MQIGLSSLSSLAVLLLLSNVSGPQAQNSVFSASRDTRVRQDMRLVNFGTSELGVETDLRAPGRLFERTLLRFSVTGVDPSEVDCVTLQLTVTTPGDCHFEVRQISGSWNEGSVDWSTKPDCNGRRLGSWNGQELPLGTQINVPLAAGLFKQGNGTYDLVLVETIGGGTNRVGFSSREGSSAPKLIIGCANLPARAGFSARRTEGEIPYTPELAAFLPADVSSATWDFGDGSAPQVTLTPQHTYNVAGRFDLTVTATSPAGVITVTRPDYIFAHRPDAMLGSLVSYDEVNDVTGGSLINLSDEDYFGRSVGAIGDLDGDGVIDIMVGAVGDDTAADRAGAVYILLMRSNGTVKASTMITEGRGGFTGDLDDFDGFGREVAPIGDLDGDGVLDVAIGANGDDDMGFNAGSVWILYLNTDGTVKSHAKITGGGINELSISDFDEFGRGIACIDDVNGDGVQDLAVGAIGDDVAGNNFGNVWILYLNTDGSVKDTRRINGAEGGLNVNAVINPLGWWFGISVSPIGDVNGDGICDIVVGAVLDNAVPLSSGAAVVLLLNNEGTVLSNHLINGAVGGDLDYGELWVNDQFGGAVAGIGDVDADGIPDIAVTSFYDDDNVDFRTDLFEETGAVFVMFLNSDGSVRDYQKISATRGGLSPMNNTADRMGEGLSGLGDLDGDGSLEILVGSRFSDPGGPNRGNVRIMHLMGANTNPGNNIVELGCGVNPVDSLQILLGNGSIGTSMTFGVDNPLGSQPVGSLPFVSFTGVPDVNFPCGTLFNGFGMDGGPGELLIRLSPPPFKTVLGPAWTGAGNPSPVVLNIPPNPAIVGFKLYAQGRMFDPTPGAPLRIGLTGAFEITILP